MPVTPATPVAAVQTLRATKSVVTENEQAFALAA
jgi:hypothetical protein